MLGVRVVYFRHSKIHSATERSVKTTIASGPSVYWGLMNKPNGEHIHHV